MTAPSSRKRVRSLVRLKLPVTHLPAGTFSWAPPFPLNSPARLIALRKASVFDVLPSPTPPNSCIENTAFLAGPDSKKPEQVSGPARSCWRAGRSGIWPAGAGGGPGLAWSQARPTRATKARPIMAHVGLVRRSHSLLVAATSHGCLSAMSMREGREQT